MQALKTGSRLLLTVIAGALTILSTQTARCVDIGGVPSWERCWSWLGNPIIEWPGDLANNLIPLVLGVAVGAIGWWLLGFTPLKAAK